MECRWRTELRRSVDSMGVADVVRRGRIMWVGHLKH